MAKHIYLKLSYSSNTWKMVMQEFSFSAYACNCMARQTSEMFLAYGRD